VERHLAALEALDGDAGAGLLALGAFARRLAKPRFLALVAPGLSLISLRRIAFVP